VIQQGREVAFLIEGAAKAKVVRDVFCGAYDPEAKPAQLIRPASGRLTLLLDAAAAEKLPRPAGSEAAGTGSSYVATLEI
jgi:6-phosphogluconolactonase